MLQSEHYRQESETATVSCKAAEERSTHILLIVVAR